MWVEKLKVQNCRILKNVDIEFSPHFNIVSGDNGSGKTSLLEALSLLSRGRSFRTSRIAEVISYENSSVLISSLIHSQSGISSQIGIEKSVAKTHIRINKKDIHSQSELSRYLPITVIHPDSIKLIIGSPSERRSFIDWLCFYLHPGFHQSWKAYQHILKQRNSCLKNKAHRYAVNKWTDALVDLQPEIHNYRRKALEIVKPLIEIISSEILGNINCSVALKSGFPSHVELEKKELRAFYAERLDVDLKFGRTNAGVHRSDLNIFMNGTPAIQSASRGQLKLISIALLLAQSNAIHNTKKSEAIILIDDITAELDKDNKNILLNYLAKLDQQLILTTPSDKKISLKGSKLFHVKHGVLTQT